MNPTVSLDGVCVAQTRWSLVDGQNGRLIVCGQELKELVSQNRFEDLVVRMLPTVAAEVVENLGLARVQVSTWVWETCQLAQHLPPIEAQRLVIDRLPVWLTSDLCLIAAMGLAVAYQVRLSHKLDFAEPDPNLSHCRDLMRLVRQDLCEGAVDLQECAQGLETYLLTVAEHGMNASTFTARVVASTRAGHRAAVSAAMGALQGPLHGGAPGPVLDMLDELAQHSDPGQWLEEQILGGERLMGFGHRIYKVRDPRAEVLGAAAQRLCLGPRFELAQRVEGLARQALAKHKPGRQLETNVEYYTALLLDSLGFDRSLFTAIFAAGRVLGWLAHVREQEETGRLIRPECQYVGPMPN